MVSCNECGAKQTAGYNSKKGYLCHDCLKKNQPTQYYEEKYYKPADPTKKEIYRRRNNPIKKKTST